MQHFQHKIKVGGRRWSLATIAAFFAVTTAAPLLAVGTAQAADGAEWPSGAPVTSLYGYRCQSQTNDDHKGIDLGAASGAPVYAT